MRLLMPLALLVIACASLAPTPAPGLAHFGSDGLAFDYPSTWNAATYDMPSSFNHWWVWLSTEPLADPCDRTSGSGMTSISCDRSPVVGHLQPDGLLLDWSSNGWLGWEFDANAGESIRVAGRQATLEVNAADSGCAAISGQTQVRVVVPSEVPNNWTEMDACVAGSFDGTVKHQVMALLASVSWP